MTEYIIKDKIKSSLAFAGCKNFVQPDKKVKDLTNYEKLLITNEVINIMLSAKKDQIKAEPKEKMWKEDFSHLHWVSGEIPLEEESWFDDMVDEGEQP